MFIFPMYFSVPETWLFNVFFFAFRMYFSVSKTYIFNTFFYHGAFSHYYNKLIIIRLSIIVDLIFKVIKWANDFIIILVLSEILILSYTLTFFEFWT